MKRNSHVCIWCDRANYVVVLKQIHKEYADWKKSGARL